MRPRTGSVPDRRTAGRTHGSPRGDADVLSPLDRVATAAPLRGGTDSIKGAGPRPAASVPVRGDPADNALEAYLAEIGKASLLTAEEEVVLGKAILLGRQIVGQPEWAIFSLWEWTTRDTEPFTRSSNPA